MPFKMMLFSLDCGGSHTQCASLQLFVNQEVKKSSVSVRRDPSLKSLLSTECI